MQISTKIALEQLKSSDAKFLELFQEDGLTLEIYKPEGKDLQNPHTRNEVYIIIEGSGTFNLDGKLSPFSKGDFIFVPAYVMHRFESFSEDFSTWVLFFGEELEKQL